MRVTDTVPRADPDSGSTVRRHALRLDGSGGAVPIAWPKRGDSQLVRGVSWVHLNWDTDDAEVALVEDLNVDPVMAEALLAQETRPRAVPVGNNQLIILRGVNPAPSEQPEDMVSIRLLVNERRIVSLSRKTLLSVRTILRDLEMNDGPRDAGGFIAALVEAMVDRIGPEALDLEDQIDALEDRALDGNIGEVETALAVMRRRLITLRRYLSPQRDALIDLATARIEWLGEAERLRLREQADRLTRILEDLDAYRDRGQVIQEEITYRVTRQLNRNTYILTLAAGVLLPLNLVTGLFGMNVGGIPGKDWVWAFALICGCFALFVVIFLLVAKRLRLF
jgi:zinc transporter